MQQEAEMHVFWHATFHCGGSRASTAHSATILCPGSREPWVSQIPAPCFGSNELPPRALSETPCMFNIFCLSTPYSDVPPLEIFLQCCLTLASQRSIAFLAVCCWQASPLPGSILKSFSDLQVMTRTVLIAFWLRLCISGQATCLYCTVRGCQSHTHHICLCYFLFLRDLFLPFTDTAAPLNESVYALIYAKLNHQLGSGESFPKGKLLSFPSETGHNITFTTFFWNDKL